MPISSRTFIGSTLAFLLVGFVALIAIVSMIFWLGERAQVSFGQVLAARDMRAAAAELKSALQTAESSQRGFMVGANEIYLAPYDTAKSQSQRQLATLKEELASVPGADTQSERLSSIVSDKFGEMDQTITLKRARHDDEALALFTSNKGKALMDEANVFLSGITRQADQRLEAGVAEQQSNAFWLRLVSAVGGLVIIAVAGGSTYMAFAYTRELRRARDELNVLNAGLEERVASRTVDLEQSRDRAQMLVSEVNHRVANSLALVSSLVSLQSKSLSDEAAKSALTEVQDRIFAISLVHRRLYSANDVRSVTLDEYLGGLLDHLKTSLRSEGQGTTLSYTLEPVRFATDASVNLGIVVTEWVTNAFKYAYPDGRGEIRVTLKQLADGQVELVVEDDGVGRSEGAPAKGTGIGSRIVSAMARTMGASIDYVPRNPGTAARMLFTPKTDTATAQ